MLGDAVISEAELATAVKQECPKKANVSLGHS